MKSNQLCGPEFRRFLDIMSESYETMEEVNQKAGEAISEIASLLCIEKVIINFLAPASFISPKGELVNRVLYDSQRQGIQDQIEIQGFQYKTGEDEKVYVEFYLHKDRHKTDSHNQEEIAFVAKLIFAFGGRNRIMYALNKMKVSDVQTMLPNTEGFLQRAHQYMQDMSIHKFVGIFLNIKNFKYVNKIMDYRAGNRILEEYVAFIQKLLSEREVFARLGGDNFVLLIERSRLEEFLLQIKTIHIQMEDGPRIQKFSFGCRIGVMYLDQHLSNPGQILMGTSIAMQMAKNLGNRDVVIYSPEMNAQILAEKEISMNYGKALAKREFLVYYQPKVEIETGKIIGAEALARWMKQEELLEPAAFIPALERNGSICKLDFYVLDMACRDLKNWILEGNEAYCISSNFSRWNLRESDFVERILQVVDRYQLEHHFIELEITETSSFEDYDAMICFSREIKKHGFRIAIDDFGEGFSSLNLLKNIEVDVLKLDKSFLANGFMEDKNQIILEGILYLANRLKIDVLAEGIETSQQRDFIKEKGIRSAQGYFYAKPMPSAEFQRRLKE